MLSFRILGPPGLLGQTLRSVGWRGSGLPRMSGSTIVKGGLKNSAALWLAAAGWLRLVGSG